MLESHNVGTLLVLPNLCLQNVNAISSPSTWGFPSMTSFLGLMWALERQLTKEQSNLIVENVGVICHDFEPQITSDPYKRKFHLTRNPLNSKGETSAIIEEGRAHMELTLVFGIDGIRGESTDALAARAQRIDKIVSTMRIAGGTIVSRRHQPKRPHAYIVTIEADAEKRAQQFQRLRRKWLPGFTLVCRDDLLQKRLLDLKGKDEKSTLFDAWLDLSRLNWRAHKVQAGGDSSEEDLAKAEWRHDRSDGWIVPIPIGYRAISKRYQPGVVTNARDDRTHFRFVESIYSIGQWIGPHHLTDVRQMLWYAQTDVEEGLYRCEMIFK